ncbi:PEP-CTERM sorting domain-containing protein [Limisphaera sp. VF-2]|uniref:PEP-CTERM sorting domain-containing protein n=1 Tax=Limisphaera sp. VF-2 TaxID=3400418 RepID=UPI0030A1BC50
MKTLRTLLASGLLFGAFGSLTPLASAQNAVVDPSLSWSGWMNVYELSGGNSQGNYLWGSGWAVNDLPAVWSATEVRLGPNVNTWNPSDPYWVVNGQPNKWMEANLYVDMGTAWGGQAVSFSGTTLENSLVGPYTAVAFIKEFTSSYGWVGMTTAALSSGQPFSVNRTIAPGNVTQFGFMLTGPNADPATVDNFGKVRIAVIPEPAVLALLGLGAVIWLAHRRRGHVTG